MTAKLRAIAALPETPEQILRAAFRHRDKMAREVAALDRVIALEGRKVAHARGVGFIRVERLRAEFGE